MTREPAPVDELARAPDGTGATHSGARRAPGLPQLSTLRAANEGQPVTVNEAPGDAQVWPSGHAITAATGAYLARASISLG